MCPSRIKSNIWATFHPFKKFVRCQTRSVLWIASPANLDTAKKGDVGKVLSVKIVWISDSVPHRMDENWLFWNWVLWNRFTAWKTFRSIEQKVSVDLSNIFAHKISISCRDCTYVLPLYLQCLIFKIDFKWSMHCWVWIDIWGM